MEAILITSFLLISQNRQNVHAEKRPELEYEVNVRSYRKIRDLQDILEAIANRSVWKSAKSNCVRGGRFRLAKPLLSS